MNFLKKKLKPLASGLNYNTASNSNNKEKDLEDDLYDEYVVEAPPHPSELLALGVDPTEIDINDPEKLKELYRKAKEEGKDKKTNSVLLAKQRQKEEIEEKKKTREEWKYFDSLTARAEQAVKESQKTLEQLKESSALDKLTEPDYELRQTADEVFKSSSSVKVEKSADSWVNFGEEESNKKKGTELVEEKVVDLDKSKEVDECPKDTSAEVSPAVVEELLQDFGINLKLSDQNNNKQHEETKKPVVVEKEEKPAIDLKVSARPRPRPNSKSPGPQQQEEDPFDTSFVATTTTAEPVRKESTLPDPLDAKQPEESNNQQPLAVDPFDTSYVNF